MPVQAPEKCLFCDRMVSPTAADAPDIVWQFPWSIAYLGSWQYYQGYCVLVSRRHARELHELPEDERQAFLEELCLLARAIAECFRPHKLNYELLGNQVPHLHWHVFPRSSADPERLKPVWLALDRAEQDASERRRLRTGAMPPEQTRALLREKLRSLIKQ